MPCSIQDFISENQDGKKSEGRHRRASRNDQCHTSLFGVTSNVMKVQTANTYLGSDARLRVTVQAGHDQVGGHIVRLLPVAGVANGPSVLLTNFVELWIQTGTRMTTHGKFRTS